MAKVPASLLALTHRDFRLFLAAQVVSTSGTWLQRVAQDLVVLQLSHGSGVALGATVAAQFAPILLFGLFAGAWADRLPIRRMIVAEQITAGLLALCLAGLAATGTLALWHVITLAGLLGCCTAASVPLQQKLFAAITPEPARNSAIALNSGAFHACRILGTALAGPAVAIGGTAIVFAVNGVTYAVVVIAVAMMHPAPQPLVERAPGQIRQCLAYVGTNPTLRTLLLLCFAMNIVAMPIVITLLPLLAAGLSTSATSLGLVSTLIAGGAVLGQLEAARHTTPQLRHITVRIGALGALAIAASPMPDRWWALIVMSVLLAAASYGWPVLIVVMLHETDPEMLGRVTALWYTIGAGTLVFGPPLMGWLATAIGTHPTIGICGALTLLTAVLTHSISSDCAAGAPLGRAERGGQQGRADRQRDPGDSDCD